MSKQEQKPSIQNLPVNFSDTIGSFYPTGIQIINIYILLYIVVNSHL